jgi:hypothetical protein
MAMRRLSTASESGSRFDSLNFLQPGYLFVYTVRSPVPGLDGQMAVSKQLQTFMPAMQHGEIQPPSAEAAYLEAERKLGQLSRKPEMTAVLQEP